MGRIFLIVAICMVYVVPGSASGRDQARSWAEDYYNQVNSGDIKAYSPDAGLVPDESAAIAIAVAVWKPIYGDEHIEKQKPWQAFLIDNHWVVLGSLPQGLRGGVAQAVISRESGEIVHVVHTK